MEKLFAKLRHIFQNQENDSTDAPDKFPNIISIYIANNSYCLAREK